MDVKKLKEIVGARYPLLAPFLAYIDVRVGEHRVIHVGKDKITIVIPENEKNPVKRLAIQLVKVAYGHIWRRGNRELPKWIAASEYVARGIVETWDYEMGGRKPEWDGEAVEEVYERIPKVKTVGEWWEIESDEMEEDIKETLEEVASWGNLPGQWERFTKRTRGRVPWRRILYRYLRRSIKRETTWGKPRKKVVWMGVVLPGTRKKRGRIGVVIDTSGSIDNKTLGRFMGELWKIAKELNVEIIGVAADAKVQGVKEIKKPEDVWELPLKGRGGTDFRPAIEYLDGKVDVIVYLTDGFGIYPSKPPKTPVIFAYTGRCRWRPSIKLSG